LKLSIFISVLVALTFLLNSCENYPEYPDTPQVLFKDIRITDTIDVLDNQLKMAFLTLTVIDGDGDLGLSPSDTAFPFQQNGENYYNLYIEMYGKKNQVFSKIDFIVPLYYRFPYIPKSNEQVQSVKADMIVAIENDLNKIDFDTVIYKIVIKDRTLNASDTAVSPEIYKNLTPPYNKK